MDWLEKCALLQDDEGQMTLQTLIHAKVKREEVKDGDNQKYGKLMPDKVPILELEN